MLMIGIVPHQYQRKIFEIVTRESVETVVREGLDVIIGRVKKAVSSNDFLAGLSIFQVTHFIDLFESFLTTLNSLLNY